MRRSRISYKGSRRLFMATAVKTRHENYITPMRGGVRL